MGDLDEWVFNKYNFHHIFMVRYNRAFVGTTLEAPDLLYGAYSTPLTQGKPWRLDDSRYPDRTMFAVDGLHFADYADSSRYAAGIHRGNSKTVVDWADGHADIQPLIPDATFSEPLYAGSITHYTGVPWAP